MAADTLSSPCPSRVSIASVVVMASSTSSASAMISAPSEMRCMSMPSRSMTTKTMASVSGMASAMTRPGLTPRLMKLTDQDDADRLPERRHEFRDRAFDGHRLVRDQDRLDAQRQFGLRIGHHLLDVFAQRQDVAAVAHGDSQPDRRHRRSPGTSAAADRHSRAGSLRCRQGEACDRRRRSSRWRYPVRIRRIPRP